MNKLIVAMLVVVSFAMGLLIGGTHEAQASYGYVCNDGLSICLEMEGVLPEIYEDSILNFQGLETYTVHPGNWTFMQFSIAGLPAGTTPEELVGYLDSVERNIQRTTDQIAVVPLLYPVTEPAPLCLRDASDGSFDGVYVNNGNLQVIGDDPRCYGICDDVVCPPAQSPGGIHGTQQDN